MPANGTNGYELLHSPIVVRPCQKHPDICIFMAIQSRKTMWYPYNPTVPYYIFIAILVDIWLSLRIFIAIFVWFQFHPFSIPFSTILRMHWSLFHNKLQIHFLFSFRPFSIGLLRLQQIYQGLRPGNETFQVETVKRISNATNAIDFLRTLEELNRWSRKYIVLDCPTDMAKNIIVYHVRDLSLGRRTYHYLLSGLVSSFTQCHLYWCCFFFLVVGPFPFYWLFSSLHLRCVWHNRFVVRRFRFVLCCISSVFICHSFFYYIFGNVSLCAQVHSRHFGIHLIRLHWRVFFYWLASLSQILWFFVFTVCEGA